MANKVVTLLASAARTAAVTHYYVGLGVTAATNVAANTPAPAKYRVLATHGTADAHTYSVSCEVLE